MIKALSILLFILSFALTQAQEVLSYNDYIDYYRENVKSTILTKEGDFLKNGKYKFIGKPKDFKFLLTYILRYNIDDFNTNDTLSYEGEIKDSIKVNIWYLTTNRKGKQLDLIYHEEKGIVISGVDFNFEDNKYGLINQMLYLKSYDNYDSLDYQQFNGINVYYNFENKNIYLNKRQYYNKNNILINNFYACAKENKEIIYSEETTFTRVSFDKKKKTEEKKSFYQYNDSCWFEMTNITDLNKIDKKIYEQIDYWEERKDVSDVDVIAKGLRKHCGIIIQESIKGDKLVMLKISFETNGNDYFPFNDFLKTNYYPMILYDKTNSWLVKLY